VVGVAVSGILPIFIGHYTRRIFCAIGLDLQVRNLVNALLLLDKRLLNLTFWALRLDLKSMALKRSDMNPVKCFLRIRERSIFKHARFSYLGVPEKGLPPRVGNIYRRGRTTLKTALITRFCGEVAST
jgi:hypothetical protein